MGKLFASEFLPDMALLMQIWLAMTKRQAVRCVHCHLRITRNDIVVSFPNAASIHVRCWPVNTTNGSALQSAAPPISKTKAFTSARDPRRRSRNGRAFPRPAASTPQEGALRC
jgi:hypothetical protein